MVGLRARHSNTRARKMPGCRGKRRRKKVKERNKRTHRIKRIPIVCRAASRASSGSAPAGVTLARIDSRASGVPRELSNVPASAASLFDARICCTSISIASAGEGCCCCWAPGAGCPAAAAAAAGSVVCEAEAAAVAADPDDGVADADADGVGKGLLAVILFFFSEEGGWASA